MAVADRGYANLLAHLQQPVTTLPISTIQASIAHYLAHLSPSPTPLSGTVVSSPLFLPYSHTKLQALTTAFRHSVHIKCALLKEQSGLFSPSRKSRLRDWVTAALSGLQGGQPVMRLASVGGVLMGLDDVDGKMKIGNEGWKRCVEDEAVVALAEIMDMYVQTEDGWEKEFQPETEKGEVDALSLALILASQSLPHVGSDKLTALPFSAFIRLLTSTISLAFESGSFLSSISSSITPTSTHRIHIDAASQLSLTIQTVSSSSLLSFIGPLSKLTARSLSLFLECKPERGLLTIAETFDTLDAMAVKVESDWARSTLATVTDETDIAPDSRELTTSIWTVLKTLLFSTIMITDAALSSLVFIHPTATQRTPSHKSKSTPTSIPLPPSLALTTLHTLSNLSFIISQFGGVTTTSTSTRFPELKKVFYLALDILSTHADASGRFVAELCEGFRGKDADSPWLLAKKACALASIEQLVPVLGEEQLRDYVFPLCLPHLSDSAHRETYESAHSVVLAIFAENKPSGIEGDDGPGFAERIVPFYTECLIENSTDGKLSVTQLRLAFSSLVRGAGKNGHKDGYLLVRFCTGELLRSIYSLSSESERRHRLHLTLVSTLPSLPLELLPNILDEIKRVVKEEEDKERRQELMGALFGEIEERVGDREKEFAVRWWGGVREELGVDRDTGNQRDPVTARL